MGRSVQGELPFKGLDWGGKRKGAGRKPNGKRALVARDRRAALAARFPVHVTMKIRAGLPSMRGKECRRVLFEVFGKACERPGFRVVHFSIQTDHLHLIVEGKNRERLSRGLQGLAVRVARAVNRLWQRSGRVFADRYHDHVLRTPREVRNALLYVLQNAKRHGRQGRALVDVCSSALWFDGWREPLEGAADAVQRVVAAAHTWLLKVGWRRHGRLTFAESPDHWHG